MSDISKIKVNGVEYDIKDEVARAGSAYDDTELRNRISTIEGKEATWNAKQNAITDLAAIRSGAALGATAVQPEAGKGLFSGNYNDLTNKPTIPETVTDAHINSLIDAKLGVIENGSY